MVSVFFRRITPLALPLLLAGCNFQARQSFMDPKGIIAQKQYDLFMLTFWVTMGIFVVVGGALLWTAWRYRERKKDADAGLPSQSHGNPLIEIGLIGVSVALLVIIAVPTLREIWYTHDMPEDPESNLGAWFEGETAAETEEEPLIVYARGWQWWFSFEYPQLGITTGNEFAIPAGKTVRMELRGQDVIHSFWLPKIAGKVDMIPVATTTCGSVATSRVITTGNAPNTAGNPTPTCSSGPRSCPSRNLKPGSANAARLPSRPLERTGTNLYRSPPASRKNSPTIRSSKVPATSSGKAPACSATPSTVPWPPESSAPTSPMSRTIARSPPGGWSTRPPTVRIDREKQYENFYEWIRRSEDIKPGNLMYYGTGGLENVDLSDEEVRQIAAFLQTLE